MMITIMKLIKKGSVLFCLPCLLVGTAHAATVDIQFNWDASTCAGSCVSGVDGYKIYAVGGGEIADTATAGTTVSNYSLTPNVEQCFTVTAYNADGESANSAPGCLKLSGEGPTVPTSLTVTFPVN